MDAFSLAVGNLMNHKTLDQEIVEAIKNSGAPLTSSEIKSLLPSVPDRESVSRKLLEMVVDGVIEKGEDVPAPPGTPRKTVATYQLKAPKTCAAQLPEEPITEHKNETSREEEKAVATRVRGRRDELAGILEELRPDGATIEALMKRSPGASYDAIKQALLKLEKAERAHHVSTDAGTRVYFFGPAKKTTSATSRKAAKTSAAPKASPSPKKSHQRPVSARKEALPAALPQADGFRCGVMSDGSLRLEGIVVADDKSVSINKGQASIMVAYLRQLEMLGEPA